MRLTKFSDYALRALLHAASRPDELVTIEQTSDQFGISRAHMKKVVRLLTREGFLRGVRGRTGGYTLARAPEEINLGQVLRATEPDFGMVECFLPGNRCCITRRCGLPSVIDEALAAFIAAFDRHTLAQYVLAETNFPCDHRPQPQRGPHLPPGRSRPL
ncbi:RrF2 family transcriptional regulator [Phaeovulum sp.]|uniref:RrF2 family transcriptional regulator n=1 Tax=Phaeovulum sp. TaxID=2934796 RepID=UPI00272F0CCB|nr:Rrf2 family transcriptional regulator [Phaeovulum sp.]MDP1668622.1 Rrf2 family transcriptional regulator [Phaeovulum sp.]MDZ4119889.1 Rrf2 family transcriptional regulator [Phaeovulum sp.]